MKKLLTFALAALAALTLRAGEEDAVKNVFTTVNTLACELKMSEVLRYYAEDFVEVGASGKKITKAEAVKLAAIVDVIGKEDASVAEIWAAIAGMQGRTPSAEELAKAGELEKKPESRRQFQAMRAQMKTVMQHKLREQAASFRFISVRVDGDRAVAVYREKDVESPKWIEHRCELVKRNGQWLIRRDNGRYVDAQ